MKRVGFKRKINWDWDDPLVILFLVFTGIGIFSAGLVTVISAWNTAAILLPTIFGGIGVEFGLLALIISYFRD